MNKPIATFDGYSVYKRTFEARKFPVGSDERKKLNESSITSEYMISHKYAVIGEKFSTSCAKKEDALERAKVYSKQKF